MRFIVEHSLHWKQNRPARGCSIIAPWKNILRARAQCSRFCMYLRRSGMPAWTLLAQSEEEPIKTAPRSMSRVSHASVLRRNCIIVPVRARQRWSACRCCRKRMPRCRGAIHIHSLCSVERFSENARIKAAASGKNQTNETTKQPRLSETGPQHPICQAIIAPQKLRLRLPSGRARTRGR